MSLILLDSENADRDITSLITCLTHTPDANQYILCQGYIRFGDGTKNLGGVGGNYQLVVSVGSQIIQPSPQVVQFDTSARTAVWTTQFPVLPGEEVLLRVLSPNSGETDVDVTAYLYQVGDVTPSINGAINDAGADADDFDGSSSLSSTDDFYNNMVLVFTTGTLKGIARKITDYVGSSRNLSFTTAFPTSPANGDKFVILGLVE